MSMETQACSGIAHAKNPHMLWECYRFMIVQRGLCANEIKHAWTYGSMGDIFHRCAALRDTDMYKLAIPVYADQMACLSTGRYFSPFSMRYICAETREFLR